jgi:hypothetical protein
MWTGARPAAARAYMLSLDEQYMTAIFDLACAREGSKPSQVDTMKQAYNDICV